jgi:hypothetical protein
MSANEMYGAVRVGAGIAGNTDYHAETGALATLDGDGMILVSDFTFATWMKSKRWDDANRCVFDSDKLVFYLH